MRNGASNHTSMSIFAAFAGGALAGIFASRVLPPIAAQASGAARVAAGGDPFAALQSDHRALQALLGELADTPDQAIFGRTQRLFRLKHRLAAHALAEEDVVYPLLGYHGHAADDARALYREHADMKMLLYKLEQMPKDDPAWRGTLLDLKALIEGHIREEEDVEFPRLRAALDEAGLMRLSAHIHREKALLL